MCVKNAGLQSNGQCADDEFCAGPSTLEEAICGKTFLCTKKGSNGVFIWYNLYQVLQIVV